MKISDHLRNAAKKKAKTQGLTDPETMKVDKVGEPKKPKIVFKKELNPLILAENEIVDDLSFLSEEEVDLLRKHGWTVHAADEAFADAKFGLKGYLKGVIKSLESPKYKSPEASELLKHVKRVHDKI